METNLVSIQLHCKGLSCYSSYVKTARLFYILQTCMQGISYYTQKMIRALGSGTLPLLYVKRTHKKAFTI